MAEVTEGDRDKAREVLGISRDDSWFLHIADQVAAALAEERERERLQWNPMIGRVLQVAMKWTNSGDPRLAACAQQIHAAIGGSQ